MLSRYEGKEHAQALIGWIRLALSEISRQVESNAAVREALQLECEVDSLAAAVENEVIYGVSTDGTIKWPEK